MQKTQQNHLSSYLLITILLIIGLMFHCPANPQITGDYRWTWIHGQNDVEQLGIYGTRGIASPENVPGARYNPASWIDADGVLWLFGGSGVDSEDEAGLINDLWKFDSVSGQWTWIKGSNQKERSGIYGTQGVADEANVPGARRSCMTWRDAEGSLWLFGGYGYDSAGNVGDLNDLWKYNPVTNQWAWMHGSDQADQPGVYGTQGIPGAEHTPGARRVGIFWTDASGLHWLFSGSGFDESGTRGFLNDLWKYDPVTNQWTWMHGSNTADQAGVYGTQGLSAPTNIPGSRRGGLGWTDRNGTLWLFAGVGLDSTGDIGNLNDLWRYDISTGEFTWMKGSDLIDQPGVYGTRGIAASVNTPGGRRMGVTWTDAFGQFWLLGGFGYDAELHLGRLNDLWTYDWNSNQWIWIKGNSTADEYAFFGQRGIASLDNLPGARWGATSWADSTGSLWLFGGSGFDSAGNGGRLNDLWRYGVHYNIIFQTDDTPGAFLTDATVQSVLPGQDAAPVTAHAPVGWQFSKWTLNGEDYSLDNPITVLNANGDLTLTAVFEPAQPTAVIYWSDYR